MPSGTQKLDLNISLKPRNESSLAGLVKAVSTPGSPDYHQYLSKGQFAATFGPTQATITATENALKAEGLTVDSVSADGLTISVSTTVAGAKSAFGIGFSGYKLASGRSVYANTSAPELPAAVAGNVAGVIGLDNVASPTSDIQTSSKATKEAVTEATSSVKPGTAKPSTAKPGYTAPQTCAYVNQDLNEDGLSDGTGYYSPSALAGVYGTNTDLAAGDNGTGISVGVFELEGIDLTGASEYESCFGVTTPISVEKVDGGATIPVDYNTNTGVETGLDVQTIAGLAPGVSIVDYEGPDAINATDANVEDVYQKMVTDDSVKVISSSWGLCELDSDSPVISAENTIFQEAALQGQTVVASSGDYGSTDCYGNGTGRNATLSVDDPASQPDVLGVGGTSMQGLGTPYYVAAWNNSPQSTADYLGGATGGGVSNGSLPAGNYQTGFVGPGYSNVCGAAAGSTCRQVPDVSALADPNEGYLDFVYTSAFTFDGVNYPAGEYFYTIGGTSGATPVWASVIALADASKDCAANGPVGLVNPALYASQTAGSVVSGVVTDVTSGNNVVTYSGYSGTDYQASVGYDMTTGLGQPVAAGVAKTACAATPASPASYYVPVGPARFLDTLDGTGQHGSTAKVPPLGTIKLQVTGATAGGVTIPSTGVTAVAMNFTATQEGSFGYLAVFPDGTPRSAASNVNFTANYDVPNQVIVPVGKDGAIDVYNGSPAAGTAVLGDIEGYFTTSSAASATSTFTSITPARIGDTIDGTGVPKGTVANGQTISLQVQGIDNVAPNATAVVLNITATGESSVGNIAAYPAGTPVPLTSNVNFYKATDVPNMAIVPVGANGKINFTVQGGPTQIIADVSGYFSPGTTHDVFHASAPNRILNTLESTGQTVAGPVAGKGTLKFSLGDPGSALASADAVVGNITLTQEKAGGYMTVYPNSLTTLPITSTLNFATNHDIANLDIIPNTDGTIDFYNNATGSTQLLMDVSGYFSAS